MLKFQGDYTTPIATFDDFILLVYTMIDDLYQQFVPTSVSKRQNVDMAKISDSEIITLSICSELIGIGSENAWYSFVKRYYSIFSRICAAMPDSTEPEEPFYRSRNCSIRKSAVFPVSPSRYFAIDNFPLPVCKFGRARYYRSLRTDGADYGKCKSKRRLISALRSMP